MKVKIIISADTQFVEIETEETASPAEIVQALRTIATDLEQAIETVPHDRIEP